MVVRTVTFDSYSTLLDVDAVEAALADHVERPRAISRHWRSRSLMYTMVANEIDAYDTFYAFNRAALEHALDARGIELPETDREEILSTYHDLRVFDDVQSGLERLTDAGYDVYVVSNGNPEMLASLVDTAGIEAYVEETISADEIGVYKPNAEIYRHAAARTGTPIRDVVHVSAGFFDVLGAQHAGMTGAWLNRNGAPWDSFAGEPDLEIGAIPELLDHLEAE